MDEQNIDIPVEILQKIDSTIRLFEGDYSGSELVHLDIPLLKSLVEARLANMEKSRKILETQGKVDAFTKRDYQAGILTRPPTPS
jgi:hypothetical protein